MFFLFLKLKKAFYWRNYKNSNGQSYDYANGCDFEPGIDLDKFIYTNGFKDQEKKMLNDCAKECSNNNDCIAFVSKLNHGAGLIDCFLKQGSSFTRDSAIQLNSNKQSSVYSFSYCGFLRVGDWSNLKTNGKSYVYATNCDFPGDFPIDNKWIFYYNNNNDQLEATRFCADLCSNNNYCRAFIAKFFGFFKIGNIGYWLCGLKQGDTYTFTRDSATFKKNSVCGFLVDEDTYWNARND